MGRFAHHHAAGPGRLLQARGEVGGVTHRGVVHPQVVADLAHDHRAGMQPDSHLQVASALALQLAIVVAQRALHRERRVDGAARAVLVGDGGAEQRHHPVPGVLVDGALEAVDLRGDELEAPVDDPVHVLRIELLGHGGEARDVGEEHRDLAPLALERGARAQDLVREMPGGVGRGGGGRAGIRVGGGVGCDGGPRRGRGLADAAAARPTESGLRAERGAAARADRLERGAALVAETVRGRVLGPTGPAAHAYQYHASRRCAKLARCPART